MLLSIFMVSYVLQNYKLQKEDCTYSSWPLLGGG